MHEVKPIQGKLFGFVTHSYDQGNTETTVHRLTSTSDLDMLMIDRFLAVWGEVRDFDGSVNFYTTSPILRTLLQEQRECYPQIRICTLVLAKHYGGSGMLPRRLAAMLVRICWPLRCTKKGLG